MKSHFSRDQLAAILFAGGLVASPTLWAQGPGYYTNAGLTGSAYPLPAGPLNEHAQTYAAPRIAQDETNADHAHIPAGNYELLNSAGTNGSPTLGSPAANVQQAGSLVPGPGGPAVGLHSTPTYGPVGSSAVSHEPGVPMYQPAAPATQLSDSGCATCGPPAGDYGLAPQPSYQTVQPSAIIDSYATAAAPCGSAIAAPSLAVVAPNPWIVGANALLFDRIDDQYVRFARSIATPSSALLTTRDVDFGTAGGYEIYGGRYFGCGRYALIADYWQLNPESEMARADGIDVRTSLPFTTWNGSGTPYGLQMPTGAMPEPTTYSRYDGTLSQRLRRDQDFQSFELNLFSFALGGAARAGVAQVPGCSSSCDPCGAASTSCASLTGPTGGCAPIFGSKCSPLRFSMLAGFRWFRFDDDLEYAASLTDTMYGNTRDDIYYANAVENNLYGFQLGSNAVFCTGRRVSLLAGTKFGVFGNQIDYDSTLGYSDLPAAVISGSPSPANTPYSISVEDTDVALLGEGNLGVGVNLWRGWTANVGYRILGISGIATAPGQIPYDFGNLDDARRINRNDSLILHGLTIGGMYNW